MTVLGIDISHWQPTTPSLSGQAFVFARATYGTFRDDRYLQHMGNVRLAGLVFGAYHFGRATDIPGQIAAFLSAGGGADLLALDLERDGTNPSMTLSQAAAFIKGVQAKGRKIGLYHSESGYPQVGQDFDWVAKWSPTPPTRHYDFWQYQGTTLDRNRFNGTLAQLKALVNPAKDHVSFPAGQAVWVYDVATKYTPNVVLSRKAYRFRNGSGAPCSDWAITRWDRWDKDRHLVQITDGFLKGKWVSVDYLD